MDQTKLFFIFLVFRSKAALTPEETVSDSIYKKLKNLPCKEVWTTNVYIVKLLAHHISYYVYLIKNSLFKSDFHISSENIIGGNY